MSKKLPRISANEMIKYLVNNKGFFVTSRKGSHVSLKKGKWFTTMPAGNSKLKPGLMSDFEQGLV